MTGQRLQCPGTTSSSFAELRLLHALHDLHALYDLQLVVTLTAFSNNHDMPVTVTLISEVPKGLSPVVDTYCSVDKRLQSQAEMSFTALSKLFWLHAVGRGPQE